MSLYNSKIKKTLKCLVLNAVYFLNINFFLLFRVINIILSDLIFVAHLCAFFDVYYLSFLFIVNFKFIRYFIEIIAILGRFFFKLYFKSALLVLICAGPISKYVIRFFSWYALNKYFFDEILKCSSHGISNMYFTQYVAYRLVLLFLASVVCVIISALINFNYVNYILPFKLAYLAFQFSNSFRGCFGKRPVYVEMHKMRYYIYHLLDKYKMFTQGFGYLKPTYPVGW